MTHCHLTLKEMIGGLILTFACITITTAEQVEDRKTIPSCGHLSAQEDQYNFFEGTDGQKCCMCWKGTYLVNECSVNDPNSTRCDQCEYDSGKQTFVDFEPHTEQECKLDSVSCMPHLVHVPGSPSSSARCVCPNDTVMVNEREPICQPMSNDPLTTPSSTTLSTLQYNKFSPSSSDMVRQSVLNSETTFPQDTPATLESKKEDFFNTVEVNTSATPISASTGSAGLTTTLSNTTAADQEGLNIMFMITIPVAVGLGIVAIVVILSFRYFVGCRTLEEVLHRNPVEDGVEKPYNPGISDGSIPFDSCKKIDDPLLDIGSEHVSIQMHTNENAQNGNWARRIWGWFPSSRSPGHSALWKAVPPHEPNLSNEIGDSGNQRIGEPSNPRADDQLARERALCDEAFKEMAEVIEDKDLCTVGRCLLARHGKMEFDDIYYNKDVPGRAEKARKIFLRAMNLNPGLTLQDIQKAVEGFGYLREIVDKKIALL